MRRDELMARPTRIEGEVVPKRALAASIAWADKAFVTGGPCPAAERDGTMLR
jgi:hypothetical protein